MPIKPGERKWGILSTTRLRPAAVAARGMVLVRKPKPAPLARPPSQKVSKLLSELQPRSNLLLAVSRGEHGKLAAPGAARPTTAQVLRKVEELGIHKNLFYIADLARAGELYGRSWPPTRRYGLTYILPGRRAIVNAVLTSLESGRAGLPDAVTLLLKQKIPVSKKLRDALACAHAVGVALKKPIKA